MRIARELYDEIVSHAQAVAPQECCGIVSSDDGGAVKVYRTTNTRASEFSFVIDEREQLQINNEIEAAGLEYGAIYHSHTRSAPEPSLTDIKYAEWWPGVLWIIVGLAGGEPEVRTWLIDDGNVSEAQLVVE
jgi:[CysO sulfur-carrier protein]-S-L-cysteine hydrolase